jgi:hypothetical protein
MNPPAPRQSPGRRPLFAFVLLALLVAGCDDQIETAYGGRTGPTQGPSVNGTAVLGDMLAGAGHNVISRASLSPGLADTADAIIWFPDDFHVPNPQVVAWLERWLASQDGRTLVYVGRDFDAAPDYWQTILPTAPPAQQAEAKLRFDEATSTFNQARSSVVDGESCNWFTVKNLAASRNVTTLAGPWSSGVDSAKTDIQLYSTYQFDPADNVLLSDNRDTLVARRHFHSAASWTTGAPPSQLIVVTNGSFLLNLPLVNHEHRKLAQHLIDELPASSRVVFLESRKGGPPIRDAEPVARPPNGLAIFSIWPIGGVLLHLAVLGLLFCFARLPIFGVPRDPPEATLSDFGKHVTALGELLQLTGDRNYARARLEQYRETVHGGSAARPAPQHPTSEPTPNPRSETRT